MSSYPKEISSYRGSLWRSEKSREKDEEEFIN
jgi:hypothetical protein